MMYINYNMPHILPLYTIFLQRAPTEKETQIMANIPVVSVDEAMGGFEISKGLGNIFGTQTRKQKQNNELLDGLYIEYGSESTRDRKSKNDFSSLKLQERRPNETSVT